MDSKNLYCDGVGKCRALVDQKCIVVGCSPAEPNPPPSSVGCHDPYEPPRMTDSSSIDNDLMSLAPTAASILGIKGPLRFRPHGSSQKAHVVLRRVDPESDSDGEGDTKGVVQFSLFAYKRIEVKPGKEILLTVADGPFKDRAIIFEGDDLGAPSLSDVEEETQVAEDDDALVPPEHSLPLKMRKPWAKRPEVSVPLSTCDVSSLSFLWHLLDRKAHGPPKVAHHSVGVQTDAVNARGNILATLTDPSPTPEEGSHAVGHPLERDGSRAFPSKPPTALVPTSLSHVRDGLTPIAKTTVQKMGVPPMRQAERDHKPPPTKVEPTSDSPIPPVDKRHSTSSAPAKRDDVSTNVCGWLRID